MHTSTPQPHRNSGDKERSRSTDLLRQIVVIAATCFMLIAAVVGVGALGGTPVQDLQDGALDVDGSLLAPGRPAFSIWSVIYIGIVIYTVWQALPGQRANPRQRIIGWWIAATAVLNGLWLVAAQFATLPVTVATIVLLLIVLCVTFRLTVVHPGERWDAWLTDIPTGLHLGWVAVATVANTAGWLTASGIDVPAPDVWGVVVVAVVGVIGVGIGILSGGRLAPPLAMAWGLSWLAYQRLTGEPESTAIAVAAIIAAVAILAAAVVRRLAQPARKPEAYARVP